MSNTRLAASRKGMLEVDSYYSRENWGMPSLVVGDRGPQLPWEERCNFSRSVAGVRCIHRKEKGKPYCSIHRGSQPSETGLRSSMGGMAK
jgi:hypothetical protein